MFDVKLTQADFSKASENYATYAQLQARIGGELAAAALPLLDSGALLVDVGAGPGEGTAKWPIKAIALDAAFGMCQQAHKKNIPALQARAEALPLADESVDAISSNLMLQWLPAPMAFFNEAARVLKPGGVLAVSNFADGTLSELAKAFADAGEHHRMSDFVPSARLAAQIMEAGFAIETNDVAMTVEYYADMLDLFLYLRDIGAVNKRINRPRGLLTMRRLRAISSCYPRAEHGIPASWVTQIVVARKI